MLQVLNISKSFGKTFVLADISFEVSNGEVVGIIGENGAGKSTLLRILSTILTPDSGSANIDGFDLIKQPSEIRKNIGILFGSEVGLYDRLTAIENLKYFADLSNIQEDIVKERINYLSEKFGFSDYSNKPAYLLSKGMKQKVAIARAIIHNPNLMLFDEPDSGLDFKASRTFFDFFELCRSEGKSIVFSSHSMENIRIYSDRIIVIREGMIVETLNTKEYNKTHTPREFNELLYDLICK